MVSGIISLYNFLVVLNKRIEYRSNAYKLIDSKLESYRDTDFGTLVNGTYTEGVTGLPPGSNMVTAIRSDIESPGQQEQDIKQVTVTINWNFKGNQSVRMSTYITRGGIRR